MAATFLRQVERDWLLKKTTGFTAQTPIGQLRRVYWSTYLGGDNSKIGPEDLEVMWLRKYITDKGGTPTPTAYNTDLWKQVVAIIGQTPTNFLNDNKILFYVNAA